MKKVLLTGSEGFIGSYVVKRLLDLGYEVVGIDNFQNMEDWKGIIRMIRITH